MDKDILIKKVDSIEECKICNNLLTELISYETAFDDIISPCTNIEDYYERTLNRDDSVIYLAINKEKAVGYIMAYKQNLKRSKQKSVTIMNLYVKHEYRKKGVGKLLMEQVEKWAKEDKSTCLIELDCFVDNKSAIDFYSNLDYKPIRVKMRKKI